MKIEGNIIDIHQRRIYGGEITVENEVIKNIVENKKTYKTYISPGFIDAHVHIESSMLKPEQFSQLVIQKGTVAIINDPHEIANVLGIEGIRYMLQHAEKSLIKMFFTIPSCVPSTSFDYSGGHIGVAEVEDLARSGKFIALSEVMDVPGVLGRDPELSEKLDIAKRYHLKIDGHAPGLSGEGLIFYIDKGISTDHECTHIEEAREKIHHGMKILIREGSAAKNYEALSDLISEFPDQVMFCTDDSHPGELFQEGHIDKIVRRAIAEGYNFFDVLKIACLNPIFHYGLQIGTLQIGDQADFVVFEDINSFQVKEVYIGGKKKWENQMEWIGKTNVMNEPKEKVYLNRFECLPIVQEDLVKKVKEKIVCIGVINGEIITRKIVFEFSDTLDNLESDRERDILKLVYMNRYTRSLPQIAFIHGVGLKKGAFATSISHDSHNIIAVGCNDEDLSKAINRVIEEKGGLVMIDGKEEIILPLPIAGIMTDRKPEEVIEKWEDLIEKLKMRGCSLDSPFMTLSFMSLLVIPELKIGEKGLFEFAKFAFLEY